LFTGIFLLRGKFDMNGQIQLKKIDLGALEQTDRRIARTKIKRMLAWAAAALCLSGGVFAVWRMTAGDVVASRFTVNKLYCPGCVTTIQEVTGKLPGVIKADVSVAGQSVTVTHRSARTTSDEVKAAISGAGYDVKLDVDYTPDRGDSGQGIVAVVNSRPLCASDLKEALEMETGKADPAGASAAFFSLVGKELLLREADALKIAAQPFEVQQAVEALRASQGLSEEEFERRVVARHGSPEKFNQYVARKIAIGKLFAEHVGPEVSDPKERERRIIEWLGAVFTAGEVRIFDADLRNKLRATAGHDDWKRFWPQMISRKSELKSLITQ
jgi:copper chaperone CopZ